MSVGYGLLREISDEFRFVGKRSPTGGHKAGYGLYSRAFDVPGIDHRQQHWLPNRNVDCRYAAIIAPVATSKEEYASIVVDLGVVGGRQRRRRCRRMKGPLQPILCPQDNCFVVHRCIYIANLWLLQLFLPWTVTVRYINSDLEHSRPLSCNCRVPARMVGPGRCPCPRASPKREGRRIDRESGCGWDNGGRQKNP